MRGCSGNEVKCAIESWRDWKEKMSGQASKCARWMPRHRSAKKDVASCEKLRGAASRHGSEDIRMGKPGGRESVISFRGEANPGN